MAKRKKMSKVRVRKANSEAEYASDFDPKLIAEKKRTARKAGLMTVAEQIAETKEYRGNWPFPEAHKLFPMRPEYRYIEKFYPFAKGGPLCVDEPREIEEMEACKIKASHLAKHGFRYIWLKKGATLEDALEQLKGQAQCRGQRQSMT